jgi:trimethylamine--corrinoid protein Co-methyltransferase
MKTINTTILQTPQFSVLTESQLEEIHLAALEVLRRTGMRFYHEGALEMLKKAGAFISDGNLVKIPASLVNQALASAPSRVVMCDRDGEPSIFLERNRVYFGTGSDCIYMLDGASGQIRQFTQQDLVEGYRLCDALPNIHFVMSMGIPQDVEPERTYDVQMALMLENTTKPLVFVAEDGAGCQRAIDMAAAAVGGHQALREGAHILLYSEPSSPLQQSETALEKLLLMAERQLPVVHSPAPQMGAVAPITMAGGLVMSLAEILASLVVHQLKQPGAPFIFGAGVHQMDMKAAQICYGTPEFQLTKTAVAQLGRWYGLPTWGYAGCSDAKVMDEQAALEAMLSVMMAKLSGANLVHDVGYLESGLTTSYEMIVLTDELIALGENLTKGIEVSRETMMIEEIDRVGPGGHYLNSDQTLKRFRDFWYPSLLDRQRREEWTRAGETTLGQRLQARVQQIIKEHRAVPLALERKREIEEILSRAG